MHGRDRSGAGAFVTRRRLAIVIVAGLATFAFAFMGGKASADPASPLSVTKSASASSVPSGSQLTYTISVKNTGGSAIGTVVLTDQVNGVGVLQNPPALPQLVLTTTQGSCTQGGPNGNLVTCNAGTLAGGASFTVTIGGQVTAGAGTTLNNTASVSGTKTSQSFTTLSNTTNVQVTGSSSGNLPDLTINKTGPTSVATGTAMAYTLTVNNVGTANATGVKVVDTLPAGFAVTTPSTQIVSSSLFSCGLAGQTVTCTGGQVNTGQNATITINGTAPTTPGLITNTSVVDPDNTIAESNELNNTSATVSTQVGSAQIGPLLDIKKTDGNPVPGAWGTGAGPDPVWPGAKLTYKILVTNNATGSNATATNVVTTDPTQGLDASSIVASQTVVNGTLAKTDGCTVASGSVRCTVKSLNSLGTQAITITGTVVQSAGSTIFNTATVTGNVKNQGVTNTATETTTVRPAVDLTITKADSPDPVCASSWPTTLAPAAQHLPAAPQGLSPAAGDVPALLDTAQCLGGLTYSLVIGNSGIDNVNFPKNVEVRDPLPPGVIFDSYQDVDGAGFTCNLQPGNVVDCTGGHVGPGGLAHLNLLTVAPPTLGTITNTAYVDPNNAIFEADETNNTFTQTTTVATGIDLAVWKGDNGHLAPVDDPPGNAPPLGAAKDGFDPIATNGTETYTIIVADVGTQDASGIKVVDTLPAGTKFLSVNADSGFTCSQDGSATGGNVTCISGHLRGTKNEFYVQPGGLPAAQGEEWATIRIKVFATPFVQPAMHNVVRVDPDNTIPETNENNNLAFDDTVVTVGDADKSAFNQLTIVKTQSSPSNATPIDEVAQNGTHVYNLHVGNAGTDPVSNVVVKDFLPAGSRFISAADTNVTSAARFFCTHDGSATGGVVTCTGGDFSGSVNTIPDGAGTVPTSRDIKITIFAPNTPGTYTNHATVDPDNVVAEGNEFDNDSSVDTKVTVGGNDMFNELTITKEQTDPTGNQVATSSIVTYKLTVANTGSDPAFNVKVTDQLPSGFTFISALDTTTSPPSDPYAFVCAPGSGNTVNCTSAALDGTTHHLATPPGLSTRTIVVKAFSSSVPAVYTNTAVVDPQNTIPEGNETNNTAQVQTTVKVGTPGFIDLTVDKTGPTTVVPGQQITYDLNVHNLGTDPAFNVKVRDDLPSHTSFISVIDKTGGAGAFSCGLVGTSILCTGGTLDGSLDLAGAAVPTDRQIEIVVQAPTSISGFVTDQEHVKLDITNTAVIDPDNTIAESNETNNTSNTVTTTVSPAIDLTIKKQGPGSATQNQPTSYTITVTNNQVGAGVVAKGIEIVDPFPTGLIPLNATTSGDFSCQLLENPVNNYDCIGDLNPGDTATITLNFFVTLDNGTLDNEACVDPNNTIAETDEINNCSDAITGVAPAAPDLQINKTADQSSVTAGQELNYTLNVSNIGTAATTNGDTITVTDNVPSDVTVEQVTPDSGWQCTNDGNANHVSCSHLGMDPGDASNIVIKTKVGPNPANPFTNTATVGGDPADTQQSNNTSSVKTSVGAAAAVDLQAVSLTDNPDPVGRSDKETYTAIVTNNGTSPATGAIVRVHLPDPGTSNPVVNASNGFNCVANTTVDSSGNTFDCTGDLDASGGTNASTTITASITVDPGAPEKLTASVVADPANAIAESNELNNAQTQDTTVTGSECTTTPCVDLVTTAFGDPVSIVPAPINDTVTVANIGSSPVPDSPAWTIEFTYFGVGSVIVSPPAGVTCTPSGVMWKCTSQDGASDPMDLAPGAGLTFLVTIAGAVPGPASLLVNADSTGVVSELSESNNASTWFTLVMPPPGP
jgi:uncharacterized repeat protein (TIGR01451 family)